MRRVLRHGEKGRIPGPAGRVSIGGRRFAMAPQALVYLADSILYLSSILRDQPRQIDRYIDYFGGGAQDDRAREGGRSASTPPGLETRKARGGSDVLPDGFRSARHSPHPGG